MVTHPLFRKVLWFLVCADTFYAALDMAAYTQTGDEEHLLWGLIGAGLVVALLYLLSRPREE